MRLFPVNGPSDDTGMTLRQSISPLRRAGLPVRLFKTLEKVHDLNKLSSSDKFVSILPEGEGDGRQKAKTS